MNKKFDKSSNNQEQIKSKKSKKPYQSPRLQKLGDLRSMTLGGSRLPTDSGGGLRRDPIGP